MAPHRLGFTAAAAATLRTEELQNVAGEVIRADLEVQDAASAPGTLEPLCLRELYGRRRVRTVSGGVIDVVGPELRIHFREDAALWRGMFGMFNLLCES